MFSIRQFCTIAEDRQRARSWGTAVQTLCERIWPMLDSHEASQKLSKSGCLDRFVSVLKSDDAFAVAALVLPDLRSSIEPRQLSRQKQKVLSHLILPRLRLDSMGADSVPESDFYEEEKEVADSIELYNAKLLVGNGDVLDIQKERDLLAWLRDGFQRFDQPGFLHDDGDIVDEARSPDPTTASERQGKRGHDDSADDIEIEEQGRGTVTGHGRGPFVGPRSTSEPGGKRSPQKRRRI